jgi:hypothetical protein
MLSLSSKTPGKKKGLHRLFFIPDCPDNSRNMDHVLFEDAGNGNNFELNDHTAPKHQRKTQRGRFSMHQLYKAPEQHHGPTPRKYGMIRNTFPEPEQAEEDNEDLGEDQHEKTGDVLLQKIVAVNAQVKQAAEPEDGIDLCIELQQVFIPSAFAPHHDAADHIAGHRINAKGNNGRRRKVHEGKHEQQHSHQEPGILQQPWNDSEELFHFVFFVWYKNDSKVC